MWKYTNYSGNQLKRLPLVDFTCVEKRRCQKNRDCGPHKQGWERVTNLLLGGDHKTSFCSLKNWCRDLLFQDKYIKPQPTTVQASKILLTLMSKFTKGSINITLVLAKKVIMSILQHEKEVGGERERGEGRRERRGREEGGGEWEGRGRCEREQRGSESGCGWIEACKK